MDVRHGKKVHYLVLEYVEGQDLQRMVEAHGPLDYQRAAGFMRDGQGSPGETTRATPAPADTEELELVPLDEEPHRRRKRGWGLDREPAADDLFTGQASEPVSLAVLKLPELRGDWLVELFSPEALAKLPTTVLPPTAEALRERSRRAAMNSRWFWIGAASVGLAVLLAVVVLGLISWESAAVAR
jgi:hypothetical protein